MKNYLVILTALIMLNTLLKAQGDFSNFGTTIQFKNPNEGVQHLDGKTTNGKQMHGSFTGAIETYSSIGPTYTVDLIKYKEVEENFKMILKIKGNGVEETSEYVCGERESITIINGVNKVAIHDPQNEVYFFSTEPNKLVAIDEAANRCLTKHYKNSALLNTDEDMCTTELEQFKTVVGTVNH